MMVQNFAWTEGPSLPILTLKELDPDPHNVFRYIARITLSCRTRLADFSFARHRCRPAGQRPERRGPAEPAIPGR